MSHPFVLKAIQRSTRSTAPIRNGANSLVRLRWSDARLRPAGRLWGACFCASRADTRRAIPDLPGRATSAVSGIASLARRSLAYGDAFTCGLFRVATRRGMRPASRDRCLCSALLGTGCRGRRVGSSDARRDRAVHRLSSDRRSGHELQAWARRVRHVPASMLMRSSVTVTVDRAGVIRRSVKRSVRCGGRRMAKVSPSSVMVTSGLTCPLPSWSSGTAVVSRRT